MIEKNTSDIVQAINSLRHTIEMTNMRLDTIANQLNRNKELSFAEDLKRTLNMMSSSLGQRLETIADAITRQKDS